jgi:glycosyltransferase involved in cell wall biosynthesis
MKSVLIVTEEIAPYTNGGIGRILSELRELYSQEGMRVDVLLVSDQEIEFAPNWLRTLNTSTSELPFGYPESWAYTDTKFHHISALICEFIVNEDLLNKYDVIEFCDYHGLAFSTLNSILIYEERPTIAIRLHSTAFAIRSYEGISTNAADVLLYNLELESLQKADLIICHVPGVRVAFIEMMSKFLNPTQLESLNNRTVVEVPSLPYLKNDEERINTWASKNLVFTSKIQYFKRPQVFIKAVVSFMQRNPSFMGKAIICANVVHDELLVKIHQIIPVALRERFVFLHESSSEIRERVIEGSIVVFPGEYESFCLAAYEASVGGAIVVLNARNPAFGPDSPWVSDENCFKYNGQTFDLISVLEKLFNSTLSLKLAPISISEGKSEYVSVSRIKSENLIREDLALSIIICHKDMPDLLLETVTETIAQLEVNDEICIIDDGSDPQTVNMLKKTLGYDRRINFTAINSNIGLASARNVGLKLSQNDAVVVLDADDFLVEGFLEYVREMFKRKSADVIVPQVAMFTEDSQRLNYAFPDFAVFQGKGAIAGGLKNNLGSATIAFCKSSVTGVVYREDMTALEDWRFLVDLAGKGLNINVYEKLGLHYRTRINSMIRTSGVKDWDRNYDLVRNDILFPANLIHMNKDLSSGTNHSSNGAVAVPLFWYYVYAKREQIQRILSVLSSIPILRVFSLRVYMMVRRYARSRFPLGQPVSRRKPKLDFFGLLRKAATRIGVKRK